MKSYTTTLNDKEAAAFDQALSRGGQTAYAALKALILKYTAEHPAPVPLTSTQVADFFKGKT